MDCPYVQEYADAVIVYIGESPGVEARLEEVTGRCGLRGRVTYSITGGLAPTEALAFASNVTIAAQIAAAWERGDETRETILKVYGRADGGPITTEGEG